MLTRKGLAAAVGSGVAAFAGLASDNPLWLGIGTLLGSLVLIAVLSMRAPDLAVTRAVRANTASEGDTVHVELRIEARRSHGRTLLELRDELPGEVELADGSNYALLDLKAGESVEIRYSVKLPVKGFHAVGPLRVRVEDPLGMAYRERLVEGTATVKVFPSSEDLKAAAAKSKYPFVTTGPFLVGNPGQGSAFFALRDYHRGDSMRDVNWKASARSKDLMVNQRERESQSEVTLLLDARAAGVVGTVGENSFLYSCRSTVSLSEFFLGMRSRVNLVLYGDGIQQINKRTSRNLGADVLEAVTLANPSGELGLAKVVEQLLPLIKPKTPVYLLSSLVDDPSLERAVAALRSYDCHVVVISPSSVGLALRSGAEAGSLHVRILAEERNRILASLRGMGALVLDWQPGVPLTVSLLTGVI